MINSLTNLDWETAMVNASRKLLHGTLIRGEKQHLAKLTEQDVLEIRSKYAAGESVKELQVRYKIKSGSTIRSVIDKTTWKHVG